MDAALDELGVDEEDAEFEIVGEAKLGLFGRLREEARVRARVRPTKPRPKEDHRDRRRRRAGASSGQRATEAEGAGAGREQSTTAATRTEGAVEERPMAGGEDVPAAPPPPQARSEGRQMDQEVPLAEQGDVARRFLEGMLEAFAAVGTVELRQVDEETVELAISGDQLGLLIGPRGTTLNAVQEVTRTVVQRQTGGRSGRILVDVEGYRQKRKAALQRFTREVAARVKETGIREALEPMLPADRKVVHDTVNEIDGVSTTSEGEEPRRRVIIERT